MYRYTMCGIFFLLNNTQNDKMFVFDQFLKAQHRGPENSYFRHSDDMTTYLGFHRLAINGINDESNQPIIKEGITLICNGEIYNHKELYRHLHSSPVTNSDCEVIIDCYKQFGIQYTLQLLDGVFAFVLIDDTKKEIFVARDPLGVRPMYVYSSSSCYFHGFASELKQLNDFVKNPNDEIKQFSPGTYSRLKMDSKTRSWIFDHSYRYFSVFTRHFTFDSYDETLSSIKHYLTEAVKKRVENTDRPVACLLSGGLDSSLITSIVSRHVKHTLKTFSIGLKGSEDLKYAKIVADFLKTDHTEIVVSEEDFLSAIPEVIEKIESYDTTTVRASVGNYLLGKYISENSECKVIFNGDGSDELCGGYLYFHQCPNELEFDKECKRLLQEICYYDVLRSDRSISTNGLEPRTPFLDRTWVQYYLSIDPSIRYHPKHNQCEKYLLRKAFDDDAYLPKEILWRKKEAFSDGVSSLQKSWYEIIGDYVQNMPREEEFDATAINRPTTSEQLYYRSIFNTHYKSSQHTIPHFWMPKYVDATDSSARTLQIYEKLQDS